MGELIENNWSKKDYKVVFIIAYFLGLLGGHQFYLGNKKAGFIRFVLAVSMIGLPVSTFLWIKDLIQLMRNKIADESMKTFKIKETELSLSEFMKLKTPEQNHNHKHDHGHDHK